MPEACPAEDRWSVRHINTELALADKAIILPRVWVDAQDTADGAAAHLKSAASG